MTKEDEILEAIEIIKEVAERHRMKVDDIIGKKRGQEFVAARYEAIYEIREATDLSFPEIGKLFNRDHSTIISAYRKMKEIFEEETRPADKNIYEAQVFVTVQVEAESEEEAFDKIKKEVQEAGLGFVDIRLFTDRNFIQ